MKVVSIGSREFQLSPKRIRDLLEVSHYVLKWSEEKLSMQIGGRIQLSTADVAGANIDMGDGIAQYFEEICCSLVGEPFSFFIEKISDETTLQAQMSTYNSYRRFMIFHLWEADSPEIRYEYGRVDFYTTDP